MANNKAWVVWLVMIFLFISFVKAESIYKEEGNVYMQFMTEPYSKIIKQTGFEKNLDIKTTKIKDNQYQYLICHKDFDKNKNEKNIDKFKIVKIKKKDVFSPDIDKTIDLKKSQCELITLDAVTGDVLKFGDNSIEIEIVEDNVTFSITPEKKQCNYLSCDSDIIIKNNGDTNISFLSSDLFASSTASKIRISSMASITEEVDIYECNEDSCWVTSTENETFQELRNIDEDFIITIEPSESQTFNINMIFDEPQSEYKYDVSIFYLNKTYTIDPYFNTTNTTFNEGTYSNTYLNESGFVQLNLSYSSGIYYSKIFNYSGIANYKNISWYEPVDYWSAYSPTGNTLLYCAFDGTTTCSVGDMTGKDDAGIDYGTGKFGSQALHRTTGDHLAYNGINLNPTKGSLAFWLKTDTNIWTDSTNNIIFNYYIDASNSILFYKGSSNTFLVRYRASASSSQYLTSATQTFGTEWHHFAISWDNVTTKKFYLYLDGIKQTPISTNIGNMRGKPALMYIASNTLFSGGTNGLYEDFIITNNVMTDTQILNLYKVGVLKLNLSVRSCNDLNCNGESWQEEFESTPQTLSISNQSYFQYKAEFISLDQYYTPELWNVTIGYDIDCTTDWVANYGSCLINDSRFKYYTDDNSCGTTVDLPSDNGSYEYCNYCSEDLEKVVITNCTWFNGYGGLEDYIYQDNNFYSCCILTNLSSDCSVLYSPYNETLSQYCVFIKSEFELDLNSEVYFGYLNDDKVNGKIWLNDTNTTYYCISFVETADEYLLQTNPTYSKSSSGIVQLWGKDIEDREFFITHNGLANIYWTSDNLVIDGREYLFGVTCSGNGEILTSEKIVKTFYNPVNAPITRWFWFIDNIYAIIFGGIILFLLILILAFYLKELKQR